MPAPSHRLPLPALLSRVQHRFVSEYEGRLAEAGFGDLSFAHGANVLRHLSVEQPVRASALAGRAGVSKQAISQQVSHLVDRGYVVISADPDDSRAKALLLTRRGADSHRAAMAAFAAQERAWQRRHGTTLVRELRAGLESILGA